MTDLPNELRTKLNDKYTLTLAPPEQVSLAQDGTKKYLFKFDNDKYVETTVIKEDKRTTVCLSSQSGCKYGCKFCATGKMGFHGDLSTGEILWQLLAIDEIDKFTNIVFMGMGEPLDNAESVFKVIKLLIDPNGWGLSNQRLTLSTIGIPDMLIHCIEKTKINIAWSLHSPFDDERHQLMPVQNIYPLQTIIDILYEYKYYFSPHRKLTIEYLMLKDINISKAHADALAKIANLINARVNLIPYNPHLHNEFLTPNYNEMINFQEKLKNKGVITTIRKSKGNEILAACGNLYTNKKKIH